MGGRGIVTCEREPGGRDGTSSGRAEELERARGAACPKVAWRGLVSVGPRPSLRRSGTQAHDALHLRLVSN